jgi:hypothetical protein
MTNSTVIVAHENIRYDSERDRLHTFTTRFERPHAGDFRANASFPRVFKIIEDQLHHWRKIFVLR